MNLQLDMHDLIQLGDLLQRAPDIARSEITVAQIHATLLLQGQLTLPPAQGGLPVGVGGAAGLAGSISSRVSDDGGMRIIGWVETSSPHAAYVEFGTRPHWAPLQPLIDWALAVLPGVSDESDALAAAIRIRAAIARRGTAPQPVWRRTLAAQQHNVRAIFAAAVQRIVRRLEAPAT